MRQTKYRAIVDSIREKIAKGEWAIGSKIPSQRDLAKIFEVNRSTVITALEELMADGLIEGKAGVGTIVTNNTWTLMGNPSVTWNENIGLGVHKASAATVQEINEAESNKEIIQLSKGELSPDIFPLEVMKSVVQQVSCHLTPFGYEEPKGNYKLREAISQYLGKRGIDASPSSILVVSGALQALYLISIGLLQRGSTVFLEIPSYLYSLSVFQSVGMEMKGLPMDRDGLRVDTLYRAKERGKSVLYTNPTFHNPTGILMPEKRREELMRICAKEQLPIIEDDVYRDLWLDAPPPAPLKSRDLHGNVLYLGSLSKTLSPGLRIGWVVGPEPVISRLADLKMQSDYGSSALSQYVAAEWLSSGLYEQHLAHVREQLKLRRNTALEALEQEMADCATWEVPKGGFFIWLKIKPDYKVNHLFQKALANGILLNPGSMYAERSGQFLRLSYAYASLEELRQGIRKLGQMIQNG